MLKVLFPSMRFNASFTQRATHEQIAQNSEEITMLKEEIEYLKLELGKNTSRKT